MHEPTTKEQEQFWKLCGVDKDRVYEQGLGYIRVYPDIVLKNLVNLALPHVSDKLEIRFRVGYPNTDVIRCELWTHLPDGSIQHYDCDSSFDGTPTEEDYAIPLFWLIRQALLNKP